VHTIVCHTLVDSSDASSVSTRFVDKRPSWSLRDSKVFIVIIQVRSNFTHEKPCCCPVGSYDREIIGSLTQEILLIWRLSVRCSIRWVSDRCSMDAYWVLDECPKGVQIVTDQCLWTTVHVTVVVVIDSPRKQPYNNNIQLGNYFRVLRLTSRFLSLLWISKGTRVILWCGGSNCRGQICSPVGSRDLTRNRSPAKRVSPNTLV